LDKEEYQTLKNEIDEKGYENLLVESESLRWLNPKSKTN
jgi:hypothetical protein